MIWERFHRQLNPGRLQTQAPWYSYHIGPSISMTTQKPLSPDPSGCDSIASARQQNSVRPQGLTRESPGCRAARQDNIDAARSTSGGTYFAALNVYSLLGNTAMAAQPLIVGALVDLLGLTARQAGFVSAAEMGGFAVGMLTLLRFVHRVQRRTLALLALSMIAAANAASLLAGGFVEISILRFVNGFAAAVSYSVFLTMAAATIRPERTFGTANAVSIFCTGLLVFAGPHIISHWKLTGLFLGLATLALLTAAALPMIPARTMRDTHAAASSVDADQPAGRKGGLAVILVLLMMFFLYTGHAAVWSYQERIGVYAALQPKQIGLLIGISLMVWGLLGSAIASVLALRIGRVWPQVISLGISIVAAIALVFTHSSLGFGVTSALVALSWFYGLPYQMGLLAAYDPRGKANLAGSLMTTSGAAAGPAIAAVLLGYGSYHIIGVLAGICYFIALLLVLPAALRLDRQ